MNIPQQYLPVMPYLILPDAAAFHVFMKEVFGAEDQLIMPDEAGRIMHGELRVGDAVIMFAEATEQWRAQAAGMFIYVENVDNIYNNAIKAGARDLMAPQQRDYGYTAGVQDRWGNQWWLVQG
ncbi:MAG: VOC family protein [Chitinophagaceae bacterium]|nr:VOC family protein [Chitinophagaceae bacterium]